LGEQSSPAGTSKKKLAVVRLWFEFASALSFAMIGAGVFVGATMTNQELAS
jgi:hypothetical protein